MNEWMKNMNETGNNRKWKLEWNRKSSKKLFLQLFTKVTLKTYIHISQGFLQFEHWNVWRFVWFTYIGFRFFSSTEIPGKLRMSLFARWLPVSVNYYKVRVLIIQASTNLIWLYEKTSCSSSLIERNLRSWFFSIQFWMVWKLSPLTRRISPRRTWSIGAPAANASMPYTSAVASATLKIWAICLKSFPLLNCSAALSFPLERTFLPYSWISLDFYGTKCKYRTMVKSSNKNVFTKDWKRYNNRAILNGCSFILCL